MILSNVVRFVVAALAAVCVSAHAKRSPEEMAEYHQQVARGAEALNQCLETRELKQLNARIVAKRQESFLRLREACGIQIKPRGLPADIPARNKWAAVNHDETKKFAGKIAEQIKHSQEQLFGFRWNEDPSKVVHSSQCILTPENVWGPYYVEGEPLRQDIRGRQKGIYMRLALQVIDIATCKPLEGARVDVWQANALGKYGDLKKKEHWLRGAQQTTNWGTVDFDTIFPGHYTGRVVHTHVVVRPKGHRTDPKGFVHAGQMFFDEWPRQIVEQTDPYTQNHEPVVNNTQDLYAPYSASAKHDPFAQWAWLGPNYPYDGLIAWTVVGVDLSNNSTKHG